MAEPSALWMLRLAGIAGIVGAVGWTIGDALIVGGSGTAADYPMLFARYADRIPLSRLAVVVSSPEPRLAAGALIADITVPLYLAGSWHLYRGAKPAGRWWALVILALLMIGNAWSPLGHAAFYYVGMAYKTILVTPETAHPALLELGARFSHVLIIAWLLPIVTLALGLLALGITIALGRTAWPRWVAIVINPVSLVMIGSASKLLPDPARTALDGAAFNIGWLVVYLLSTILLWNGGKHRNHG